MTSCHFTPFQQDEPNFYCNDIIILSQITILMPTAPLPNTVRTRYKHLSLADPSFDCPAPIDMLIGGDLFPHLIRPRAEIIHHTGLPSAVNTLLGWIILGTFTPTESMSLTSLAVTFSSPLDDLQQKFWNIEEILPPVLPTTDDQLCEALFIKTTHRDTNGRFCVALPFRDDMWSNFPKTSDNIILSTHGLGDARSLALKRIFNLEHRLNKDPKLYDAYRLFMNEYKSLGHMQLAKQSGKYFIPHHAVVKKDDNNISIIRVVFDASAPTSSEKSLNDVLYVGPKLQNEISDILFKCRLHCFVFTAYILA